MVESHPEPGNNTSRGVVCGAGRKRRGDVIKEAVIRGEKILYEKRRDSELHLVTREGESPVGNVYKRRGSVKREDVIREEKIR